MFLHVCIILRSSTKPQIFSSIIKAIVVNMVNILTGLSAENSAMHRFFRLFTIIRNTVNNIKPLTIKIPLELRQIRVINVINDCSLTATESNDFHNCRFPKKASMARRINSATVRPVFLESALSFSI